MRIRPREYNSENDAKLRQTDGARMIYWFKIAHMSTEYVFVVRAIFSLICVRATIINTYGYIVC